MVLYVNGYRKVNHFLPLLKLHQTATSKPKRINNSTEKIKAGEEYMGQRETIDVNLFCGCVV